MKLNVADLLFDTIGAYSWLGPHDVSLYFISSYTPDKLFRSKLLHGTVRSLYTTVRWNMDFTAMTVDCAADILSPLL